MSNLLVSLDGQVAELVLNRPEKLNAITPEMAGELADAAREINASNAIRAVVFSGVGDRAFSAGSDIKLLDTYASPWDFRNRSEYNDIIRSIRKPVVCAVNGFALGGGLELALAADILIAAETARFGAPEIKLGWVGGGGVAAGLVAAIGARNTALMLMTGDPVDAMQARDWGLVSEVVPAADLLPRARRIAERIAENAPIAAQTAKLNIAAAQNMPAAAAMIYERDLQTICFATNDADEGRRAFTEKRRAKFTGN